jgi:NADH-quinone oxidoreductase subunit G
MPDHRVLDALADELGVTLGLRTIAAVHADSEALRGDWDGARVPAPSVAAVAPAPVPAGHAVLATWHQLLDAGRLQDGEPFLAGTAKRPVARLSAATAAAVGVPDGADLTVATDAGAITLPLVVTAMADHVVWLPTASAGSQVRDALHALPGDAVRIGPAAATDPEVTA